MEINNNYEVCIEFFKSAGTTKRKSVITEMMKISSNGMDVSQHCNVDCITCYYSSFVTISLLGEYFTAITSIIVIREYTIYITLLLHLSRSTSQVLEEIPLCLAVHSVSQIKNTEGQLQKSLTCCNEMFLWFR